MRYTPPHLRNLPPADWYEKWRERGGELCSVIVDDAHWTELLDTGDRVRDKNGAEYEVLERARPVSPVSPCEWTHLRRSGVNLRRLSDGREFTASLQTVADTATLCENEEAE